eukprot:364294-Chlamydomonas_euryale.AAC.6
MVDTAGELPASCPRMLVVSASICCLTALAMRNVRYNVCEAAKKPTAALAYPRRRRQVDGGLPGREGQVCHAEVCMGSGRSVAWSAWVVCNAITFVAEYQHDMQEASDSMDMASFSRKSDINVY